MGSVQNTVHYCCVARDNRILYSYGDKDRETDNLALLCLEKTPPFHKWYFETIEKKTFFFLIENGYVYFSIADKNVESPEILRFVERFRDEFEKLSRKGSMGSMLNMNSDRVREQLVPVIRRLIASLENTSLHGHHREAQSPPPIGCANTGPVDISSSTKLPLLGKSNKQEKRKTKEHVVTVNRDIGLEEHRKSSDRRGNTNSTCTSTMENLSSQSGEGSLIPQQKETSGSSRTRSSGSQSIRKKWWRQVRIVLAIDAIVCLILFVIWLGICRGISCVS